jgi:hypothetical protein
LARIEIYLSYVSMFLSRDPAQLGEHISVPFRVGRLRSPSLVWLNDRWLLESGQNPFDPELRTSFAASLLSTFGVRATTQNVILQGATRDESLLLADRYGGTGGSAHGGSGRCGSRDGFIAKGIGKTPLVSENVDPYHRDGCMSLREALVEVMWAEIVHREFPWGAIPIVAIIDTGETFSHASDGLPRRSAIVVRPSFIRPAHFERSIFFGSSGHNGSDQFLDALRVKSATQCVSAQPSNYPSLTAMFERFAQQLGVARASRLWQGRFLTSNVSIDGELVDFGSFRSVPDWRMHVSLAGECFGGEMLQLRRALLSVAGYFAKYSPIALADMNLSDNIQHLHRIENQSFISTCLNGLGIDARQEQAIADSLSSLIAAYYERQQAITVGWERDPSPWLLNALPPCATLSGATPDVEVDLANQIAALVMRAETSNSRGGVSVAKARRFFRTRWDLSYNVVERKTRVAERLITTAPNEALTIASQFIERQIAKTVCWSRIIPKRYDAIAVACDVSSSIFLCMSRPREEHVFWVEGLVHGDSVFVLGQAIPLNDLKCRIQLRRQAVGFEVPRSKMSNGMLSIGQILIPLKHRLFQLGD